MSVCVRARARENASEKASSSDASSQAPIRRLELCSHTACASRTLSCGVGARLTVSARTARGCDDAC